ncbi:MAG: endonuclease domain-containing protein [Pseudomonadota bacterium]
MESRKAAKALRQQMTEAEQKLWYHLRAHRLGEQKFRRQQPIGRYVVDFVHFGAKLIVEADGSQHLDSPRDEVRDLWLQSQGFRIMRFWNNDILLNTDAVLSAILGAINAPSPTRGEGRKHHKALD